MMPSYFGPSVCVSFSFFCVLSVVKKGFFF
jgi:hypothetical protein